MGVHLLFYLGFIDSVWDWDCRVVYGGCVRGCTLFSSYFCVIIQ